MEYQRLVIGYHGCDRSFAQDVLLNDTPLRLSNNRYDWLGVGIYFWEHGPQRALDWANEQAASPRSSITDPFVLGAYIKLGRCFDLLDTSMTEQLTDAFPLWKQALVSQGKQLPVNKPGRGSTSDILLRYRDCAVLNWYMTLLDNQHGRTYYQTVRGAFVEGSPAFDGSAIHAKTHVRIAVRDPNCIVGYFKPKGI